MRKDTITSILLQHNLTDLTKQEIEYLLTEIEQIQKLRIGGISLRTLSRQHGITPQQVQELVENGQKFIAILQKQKSKAPRKSSIFKDGEVLEILLENQEVIIDYFEEGYNREAVYKSLACIPSNQVWSKFRTILRKQGIKLVQGDDTQDSDLVSNIA